MDNHTEIARLLRAAYVSGAIPPLRDMLEPDDAQGAYAVQAINTKYWQNEGRSIIGRKIGLTAKAVQVQLGVNQPDFGVLFDDMLIHSGEVVAAGRLIQPKVEAEVAFIIGRQLDDAQVTCDDVAAAIDFALPAIEIVDSRIADWKISFADTVADNGSSGLFVLGAETKRLQGLDLFTCGMALEIGGQVVSVGAGAACLGHPLTAATWLARTLASLGEPLRSGDIVLSGALGPMVNLKPGDRVEATIGGLGSVRFHYERGHQ